MPNWANVYVAYLYHEGLTNGTSVTTFGSDDKISAKSYITFILRALGYKDSEGDFSWDNALEFAKDNALIDDSDFNELNGKTFLRDHVAKVSYKALKMMLKDNKMTLVGKLINSKAIDKEMAEYIGLIDKVLEKDAVVEDESQIPVEETESVGGNDFEIITELTPELISKLQSYSYAHGDEPVYDFERMKIARGTAKRVIEQFYKINPYPLKPNQTILTDWRLTYIEEVNYNYNYVLRGILQEKLADGSTTQYEVEFEYKEGTYNGFTDSYNFEFVSKRVLYTY